MNQTIVSVRPPADRTLYLSRPLLRVLMLSALVLPGCGGGDGESSSGGRGPGSSAGAGSVPPGFVRFEDRRAAVTVAYPSAWHVIRQSLTQVGQLLVVTSFPLHQSAPDKNCSPRTAIERMPPDGAFLYMFEYAKPHPRLLARFMVLFRDRRRAFQAHVYIGRRATKGLAPE
jgi:hypothetical protein